MEHPPRTVEVSKPDKVLWPESAITKRAYVEDLRAVSPYMVPWLRGRPLTVVRAPDGVDGQRYFQKDTPKHTPAWIARVEIPAPSAGRTVAYTVCDRRQTLEWLGNQAALEFHPAPVRVDLLDRPDLLVVDIDPPDDAFDAAVEVAGLVLEVLHDVGLPCGVKTTGGKGLHVVAPIERRYPASELRAAAARLTRLVESRAPSLVTAAFRKQKRGGRVMLDPSRNGTGATMVAPYSPRARTSATVSFPLVPEELDSVRPDDYTVEGVPGLLDRPGVNAWMQLIGGRRSRLPSKLLSG